MFASLFKARSGNSEYNLLPSSEWHNAGGGISRRTLFVSWLRRRWAALGALVILCCIVAAIVYFRIHPDPRVPVVKMPPLYPEWHRQELLLPHQDVRTPFAGGRKYLWIAGHTQWSGWGNYMQDMVMNAQLTYVTGRSFVFDNYTWDRDGPEYSKFGNNIIPSRIPLSAIISGPIIGGPFPDGDATPRAVTKDYFEKICPNPVMVDANEVRKIHGGGATAVKIIEAWVDYLKNIQDPCVEVSRESGNPFHVFMFGTPNEILPVWPTLSRSPILQLFGWSTLAHDAFEANRHLFSPPPLIEPYATTLACPHCIDPYAPLPGLLALHLRRGDFLEHCVNLGNWGAGFNAFNSFPSFAEPWNPPQGEDPGRMDYYLKRCLPSIPQIVDKVEEVRASSAGRGLKNIYIMTNGDREWLAELKAALREKWGAWELIATSRDMVLTPEQKYVSQSVDMLIGQRAQVLIGNGFSSLTSNVAMLRMAREQPPESTRMW